jgi:hypothetical protein
VKIVEYVGAIDEEEASARAYGLEGYGSWGESERVACRKHIDIARGESEYRVTTIVEKVKP